jgi:hypothetical protein
MTAEEVARKAKAELSIVSGAFDGIEAAMMTEMFGTAIEHTAKRDKLFVAIKTVRAVREHLMRAVTDGEAIANYQVIMAQAGMTSPNT